MFWICPVLTLPNFNCKIKTLNDNLLKNNYSNPSHCLVKLYMLYIHEILMVNQIKTLCLCEDSWPYNSDYSRVEWNIMCPVIYHGSDLVCCHADVQAAAGRVWVHDHRGRTPRKHHLFLCPGCILLSVVLSLHCSYMVITDTYISNEDQTVKIASLLALSLHILDKQMCLLKSPENI